MFSNWKVKEFIATVASLFGRSRTSRRKIRDKINVAFCFDEKGHKLAAVSIKSLLKVSENKCDYNIYCVIDKKFPDKHKKTINNLVIGTKSKIVFLQANTDFNKSFRAKWPVSVFWRLMLPNLLPKIKKIIYADIDIIFRKPLIDVYNINMGKNIFAGVKDYKNGNIIVAFYQAARKPQMIEPKSPTKPVYYTNIEIKTGVYYYEDIERKTLDIIRRHGLEDKVMFSSFNHVSLLRIKELMPEAVCGALMGRAGIGNAGYYCRTNGFAFYQNRFKGLDSQSVQRRRTVEHDRMLFDDILQHIPYLWLDLFDHALGVFDVVRITLLYQFLHDERFEQFQRHLLRQSALIEFQLRTDNDYRTSRVIDTLTQQVLSESSLLTFEHV